MLKPGDKIGILGGGQLGRMLAQAAAALGLKTHIFAPEADSPAFEVATDFTCAAYGDETALADFAGCVDVVTYEFENVPVVSVVYLEKLVAVRPGSFALKIAQDRLQEKQLARQLGAQTADFVAIHTLEDLEVALKNKIEPPAILKTTRFGYDGKGQIKMTPSDVGNNAFLAEAFALLQGGVGILERLVPFSRELSLVATRGEDGAFAAFDVTENEHRNHILHRSFVPSALLPQTAQEALGITHKIADALHYIGTLAVEFFLVEEGGAQKLYVNEIAPRVHNSGHWTMDGAFCSQFEQHIRAVAGWPLGDTTRLGRAEMINLIGDDVAQWREFLQEKGTYLHLYGKKEARKGRKMGHINRLFV